MELYAKRFDELATPELYEILRRQVWAFAVEENAPRPACEKI